MIKKRMLTGLLTLSMAVCPAGRGGSKTARTSVPQGQQEEVKKNEAGFKAAAMIIFIAQGDSSLTLTYAGVEQPRGEYGIKTKVIEALDKSGYSKQTRAMVEARANPIYVVQGGLATETVEMASDPLGTKFIVADCYMTSDLGNVKTIIVEPQETTFTAGAAAVETSRSKRVSWIGNADRPVISKFHTGSETGVACAGPSVECESLHIGDVNDSNKGDKLTEQVIGKGTDVMMHSVSKVGLGVIRACRGEGVKAVDVDEWQEAINKNIVFWSALRDITGTVYHTKKSAFDNALATGMGVHNIPSGLKLYDDKDYAKLPDDIRKKVDETAEKMKNGEIGVPPNVE